MPVRMRQFDSLATGRSVKQEIDGLIEDQANALRQAMYLGMTPGEAQEFDDRQQRITQLVQELDMLQRSP